MNRKVKKQNKKTPNYMCIFCKNEVSRGQTLGNNIRKWTGLT